MLEVGTGNIFYEGDLNYYIVTYDLFASGQNYTGL